MNFSLAGSLVSIRSNLRFVCLMRHLQRERPDFSGGTTLDKLWARDAKLLMPVARETAQRISALHFARVQFKFYGHSYIPRCHETLELLRPDDRAMFQECPELGPCNEEDYLFQTKLKSNKLVEVYPANPALLDFEGRKIWDFVRKVAAEDLKDGDAALMVSHHPMIEPAVAIAMGKPVVDIRDMDEGSVFVFAFLGETLFGVTYLPVPPVPAI